MQAITIQTLEIPEASSLDETAFSLVVQSKALSRAVYTLTDFYSDPISGNIGLSCLKTETRNYDLKYSVSIENGALQVKEGSETLRELFSAVKQNPLVKGTRFCRGRRAEGVFIEFRGKGLRNKDKYCAALVVRPVADNGSELAPIISYVPWRSISGSGGN